jgi:hypothetical protein
VHVDGKFLHIKHAGDNLRELAFDVVTVQTVALLDVFEQRRDL